MVSANDLVMIVAVDLLADRISGRAADNRADRAADNRTGDRTADKAGGLVIRSIGGRYECSSEGHKGGRNEELLHGLILSR
jgi:hypothetical protein